MSGWSKWKPTGRGVTVGMQIPWHYCICGDISQFKVPAPAGEHGFMDISRLGGLTGM